MINYQLGPTESVFVECEHVYLEGSGRRRSSGTLALTNQNLIWVTLSTFGKVKTMEKFPLSDLKCIDGAAQVRLEEKFTEPSTVSFFFLSAELFFTVQEKRKARELANYTQQFVSGKSAATVQPSAIPGTAFVAETIKGTVSTIKGIWGGQPKRIAVTCKGCGASFSGEKGQPASCPYCGTSHNL